MLHTKNGAIHKKIRKTFGLAIEKFSVKVRLDTKMPGVPIILSKSVYIYIYGDILRTTSLPRLHLTRILSALLSVCSHNIVLK